MKKESTFSKILEATAVICFLWFCFALITGPLSVLIVMVLVLVGYFTGKAEEY